MWKILALSSSVSPTLAAHATHSLPPCFISLPPSLPLPGEIAALQSMEDIYNKHNGDLDAIFSELNANPAKAKKPHNRPKSSSEFAKKFLAGFYNLLGDEDAAAGAEGKDDRK